MRRTLLLLLALAAPAALLAACGDDDDSGGGDEDAYRAAWVTNLTDSEDGLQVEREDAECMAQALVDELGTEAFVDADVTPEEVAEGDSPGELLGDGVIPEEDARAVLDGWDDCTDVGRLLAEGAQEDFGLDADGVTCLAEGLDERGIAADLLVVSFTSSGEGGPEDETVLRDFTLLVDECSAGDGEGGALVDAFASSLVSDGNITEEQAQCLAQHTVDTIGRERLLELSLEDGEFSDAPADVQGEVTQALIAAAVECDVPVSAFGD